MSTNQTFAWVRRAAGRWVLRAPDGQIAAVVVPYRSQHACKNQYKATALGVERNRGSIAKYGCTHWTTGIGVAAAKRNIERYLAWHSYDPVRIAEAA